MMRIEQLMEWRWADEADSWVDHHGQYRDQVTVDDILSWFLHNGYVLVEASYRPNVKMFVVSLSSVYGSRVAQGATLLGALTNAVSAKIG